MATRKITLWAAGKNDSTRGAQAPGKLPDSRLDSEADRGVDEEPTLAYNRYVEECDEETTKVCE